MADGLQHPIVSNRPYQAYVYAYPHKTAYRPLAPMPTLADVWANEPCQALFLYVHIPFCTMRCGFCNLFTTPNPNAWLVQLYTDTLLVQAQTVRETLPNAQFARFVIGGGTPTYLTADELRTLFDMVSDTLDVNHAMLLSGIETSPDTLTREHVELFNAYAVDRISMGIQSFDEAEAANSGRPQSRAEIERALGFLHEAKAAINLDLIYGLPGQTVASWLNSLREAVQHRPAELYLYPLYVRPLTGLGRSNKEWDDVRLTCYREARAYLLGTGEYEQVSMRMFRRRDRRQTTGPIYCCQEDGMIGLGCGARSYTRSLHYSLDYAVHPKNVKEIITDYVARTATEFARIEHGFALNADEQRRRYLLQSLLNTDGLDGQAYQARFRTMVEADFPELFDLADHGLVHRDAHTWRPTELGLERSDALGPWFFSPAVRHLMEEYQHK